MAGPRFTVADIAAFTITNHLRSAIDWSSVPHLERWFQTVGSRVATQRGMRAFDVPSETPARMQQAQAQLSPSSSPESVSACVDRRWPKN